MKVKTGIGQDSHAFIENKPLILGGILIKYHQGLKGNSDADVVLHALTNAISSITTRPILGPIADKMCQQGITNSAQYLQLACQDLQALKYQLSHIAISIEAKEPHLSNYLPDMRKNIAQLLDITMQDVGITVTTGEGLTSFGQALGIQVLVIATIVKQSL